MRCDECGRETTPRRSRTVKGAEVTNSAAACESFVFCVPCHRAVFSECDWRKYPALFERLAEWHPSFAEWKTSREHSEVMGIAPQAFSNFWNASGGEVLGIEFERERRERLDDQRPQWHYRAKPDLRAAADQN